MANEHELRDEWCLWILTINMFLSLVVTIGVSYFIVVALPGTIGMLAAIPLSFGVGFWFLLHVHMIDLVDEELSYTPEGW